MRRVSNGAFRRLPHACGERSPSSVSCASHLAFYGSFGKPLDKGETIADNACQNFVSRRLERRARGYQKDVLTVITIVQSPNPILNQPCEPCDLGDKSLKRLAKQMVKTMYKNSGCGLAAPQVGVTKRLVVIDCDESDEQNPMVLVNPVLVETKGEVVVEGEGCLSIPGISVPIARPSWARVRFFDLDGEEWEIEGDGLLGRCLQHELDHLDGVTMFERCDPLARIQALRDYDQAVASGAKPGETSLDPRVR